MTEPSPIVKFITAIITNGKIGVINAAFGNVCFFFMSGEDFCEKIFPIVLTRLTGTVNTPIKNSFSKESIELPEFSPRGIFITI